MRDLWYHPRALAFDSTGRVRNDHALCTCTVAVARVQNVVIDICRTLIVSTLVRKKTMVSFSYLRSHTRISFLADVRATLEWLK